MLVMHKSVTLKYALEGRSTRTEEIPSVHQLAVHLVLDKGHQNARENEPATNLQNKHQISASWAWTLVASEATASSFVERGTMEVVRHDGIPPFANVTLNCSGASANRRARRISVTVIPVGSRRCKQCTVPASWILTCRSKASFCIPSLRTRTATFTKVSTSCLA